jgi:hypothetical protein
MTGAEERDAVMAAFEAKAMEFLGSQPKPASQMNIPQAAYKVTVPESAPVSFLLPEDPLKRK